MIINRRKMLSTVLAICLCVCVSPLCDLSQLMRFWYFSSSLTRSSIVHAQPSSGARCPIFSRTLRLLPYFVCANSKGSGETARMRWLASVFAGRLCDKYHNLKSWLISWFTSLPLDAGGRSRSLIVALPGELFFVCFLI